MRHEPSDHACSWCGSPQLGADSTICGPCLKAAKAFKVNLTGAMRKAEKSRLKGWKTTGRPES